jgi:plasmid stabilization system protein ParE
MEEKAGLPPVIFLPKAKRVIRAVAFRILEQGYPDRATKYSERMVQFGLSLAILPYKYPLCRFPILMDNGLRCAVFEKTYIFVFRMDAERLIIYNVVHVKRLG